MIKLIPSDSTWWRKPLAREKGKSLPAELVILGRLLEPDEEGVWLNSRGTRTGVSDLKEIEPGKFKTVRSILPDFVQDCLRSFYGCPDVSKGVFDLVLWRRSDRRIRFIEVKCPHWDRPTAEQKMFLELASDRGIKAEVAEWEFRNELKPHSNNSLKRSRRKGRVPSSSGKLPLRESVSSTKRQTKTQGM